MAVIDECLGMIRFWDT